MIVGIDGYYLTYKQRKGIGTYVYHLLKNLHDVIQSEDRIIVFSPVALHEPFERVSNVCGNVPVSQYVWEQWTLPNLVRQNEVDVLHCPANTRPYRVNVPVVVSVHDLIMFLPSKRTFYERYVKFFTRHAIYQSSRLITVSNASQHYIRTSFHTRVPIHTIYSGIPVENVAKVARSHEVKSKVVHFATPEPRKNTKLVLQAAPQMPEIDVILLGMTKEQVEQAWNMKVSDNVICRGYVSEDEKINELSTSLALLYVSNYEGFGFPILEAMAQSCPVIVAEDMAVREMGGNAVIQIQDDPEDVVAAVRECDVNYEYRQDLIRLGHQNLQRFNWQQTAQQTYEVYQHTKRLS